MELLRLSELNGNLTDEQILDYLKIKTETLLAWAKVEAEGLRLFEYIKGDQNSIMGLPIKDIINYINKYKKHKNMIIGNPIKHFITYSTQWFDIQNRCKLFNNRNRKHDLPNLINRIKNKDLIALI